MAFIAFLSSLLLLLGMQQQRHTPAPRLSIELHTINKGSITESFPGEDQDRFQDKEARLQAPIRLNDGSVHRFRPAQVPANQHFLLASASFYGLQPSIFRSTTFVSGGPASAVPLFLAVRSLRI